MEELNRADAPEEFPLDDSRIGARIGPFEVEAHLARGTSGDVYRARHRELRRPVALKLLDARGAEDVARFRREARAAARVNHPCVAGVFDSGEHDGTLYLAQELVAGESLAARLERSERIPWATVLPWGADLAGGLKAIHAEGLVHRDLKPGNVVIAPDDRPKIIDFGLAAMLDASKRLTPRGALVGTPLFMAPEQVSVQPGRVGPPADVFGLGATLYRALTGRAPHDTGDRNLPAFLARRTTQPALPVATLVPTLPPALAECLDASLALDPARRPSAASLEATCRSLARQAAGDEAPPAPRPRREPPSRVAAVVLTVLLLGLLGSEVWDAGRDSTPAAVPPSPAAMRSSTVSVAPPTATPQPAVSLIEALWENPQRVFAAGRRPRPGVDPLELERLFELVDELGRRAPMGGFQAEAWAETARPLLERWEPPLCTFVLVHAAAWHDQPLAVIGRTYRVYCDVAEARRRAGRPLRVPRARRVDFELMAAATRLSAHPPWSAEFRLGGERLLGSHRLMGSSLGRRIRAELELLIRGRNQ